MTSFAGIQEFILTTVSKSAIGLMLFSGAVLFLPDSILSVVSVDTFSFEKRPQFGLLFLLSLGFVLNDLLKAGCKYCKTSIASCKLQAELKRRKKDYLNMVKLRLGSLNSDEKKWVQYCLYYNQQTLVARAADSTGNTLANKHLIMSGNGNVMEMPFTFEDEVWQYLVENKEAFLPAISNENRKNFEDDIQSYRRTKCIR